MLLIEMQGYPGCEYTVPRFGIGRREGGSKIKFDWISAGLIVLLVATLVAFFTGKFPYPYGWIVITILLVFRLAAREKKE